MGGHRAGSGTRAARRRRPEGDERGRLDAGRSSSPGSASRAPRCPTSRSRTTRFRSTSRTRSALRPQAPPRFRGRLVAADRMTGEMSQGETRRHSHLRRPGLRRSTCRRATRRSARALEGEWQGEFELGGYPRRVVITVENRGDAGATAQFRIVGKQDNRLPVELVRQDGPFLRIESPTTQIHFEGRLIEASGELRGTLELGSLELPLALRRAAGKSLMRAPAARRGRGDRRALAPPRAQTMFRGDACACGRVPRRGTARVPSREVDVPDRRPDRLVARPPRRRPLLRQRRRQRLRGECGRGSSALEARHGRPGAGDAGDRGRHALRRQLRRQVLCARRAHGRAALEVRDRRRAPLRSEGPPRHAAQKPDDSRRVRRLSVEPGRGRGTRCISAAATATSTRSTRAPARSCGSSRPATSSTRRRRTPTASCSSVAGTAGSTPSTRRPARRSGASTAARIRCSTIRSASSRRPRSCERRRLHRLPRLQSLRARRGDGQGEVALQRERQLGHHLARGHAGPGGRRHVGLEPLPRARRRDRQARRAEARQRVHLLVAIDRRKHRLRRRAERHPRGAGPRAAATCSGSSGPRPRAGTTAGC